MPIINTNVASTTTITQNGTYDVTPYTSAIVNATPTLCIQKTKNSNGKVVNGGGTVVDLDGATDVGEHIFYYAYTGAQFPANTSVDLSSLIMISGVYACTKMFNGCTGITSVDLSGLTTVSGNYACQAMFSSNTAITSIDLSSLTTVSGSYACQTMFSWCTGITGALNLSSLTTVSGSSGCIQMFYKCIGITSVDLSSLTTISGSMGCCQMFEECTGITSVVFSSLTTLTGANGCYVMFNKCTSLTTLSFPALTSTSFGSYTNQFSNMLQGVTGCTVHFPSNLQSVIGSWTSVANGFGGTNTTVLFDLPASE